MTHLQRAYDLGLLILGFLVATVVSNQDSRQGPARDHVLCSRLTIVDKNGRPRLEVFVDDDGVVRENVKQADGKDTLVLFATADGSQTGVTLMQNGKRRGDLSIGPDGDDAALVLCDRSGGGKLVFSTSASGHSRVAGIGPTGTLETMFRLTDSGCDLRYGSRSFLRVNSNSEGVGLRIMGADDKLLWSAPK
jgi:hypothetical protein